MKTFIQSPYDTGNLVNKFGKRMTVTEVVDGKLTWWNGFNPKVHMIKAEDEAGAIAAFGLAPYTPPAQPTVAQCIAAAEAHITKAFGPLIVSDGLERIFKAQLEGTLASIPKTVAVATWIKTVKAIAISGSTAFPPAPHTAEEVLSE